MFSNQNLYVCVCIYVDRVRDAYPKRTRERLRDKSVLYTRVI